MSASDGPASDDKWLTSVNRINSCMQNQASYLTKRSIIDFPTNSYAFYGRNLTTTLSRYLPQSWDRAKIEELFIE